MHIQETLGGVTGIPVLAASGAWLNAKDYGAITFYCYEDDGSTIATLKEATDNAGTGEQNLAVIDRVHKYPGTGGAATLVTQTAAATYDNADDGTNDAFEFTVYASEMSDGFTHLEVTVDGGICVAVPHFPHHKRAGANMASPLAAAGASS